MLIDLNETHRPAMIALVESIHEFTPIEKDVAIELIDASIQGSIDYTCIVDVEQDRVNGYICFGPTPMTEGTYDLYWIAVHPAARSQGVGRKLVQAMEQKLGAARLIRIETDSSPEYQTTRAFYISIGYLETARIPDFYRPNVDLVIYTKIFNR